jgi:hypothetical protein
MTKLYDRTFAQDPLDSERDALLSRRLAALAGFVAPAHLEVWAKGWQCQGMRRICEGLAVSRDWKDLRRAGSVKRWERFVAGWQCQGMRGICEGLAVSRDAKGMRCRASAGPRALPFIASAWRLLCCALTRGGLLACAGVAAAGWASGGGRGRAAGGGAARAAAYGALQGPVSVAC